MLSFPFQGNVHHVYELSGDPEKSW